MKPDIKNLVNSKKTLVYYIAAVIVVLFMGINFIFIKLGNRELPPLWNASLRYLSASLILFSLAKIKNIKINNTAEIFASGSYGLLSYGISGGLLYWAMSKTSPTLASVIYSTIPLSTLIFASIFKIEKITLRKIFCSFLVLAGTIVIFYGQLRLSISPIPLIAILIASVMVSLSSIIIKKLPKLHPITTNAIGMSSGGSFLLVLSFLLKEQISLPTQSATWFSLIWLTLSSTITFVLLIWIIKSLSVNKTSYISVITPLITLIVSSLLTHERISSPTGTGALLIISAITLNSSGKTTTKDNVL